LKILILNYEYPPLGGGAGIVTQHLANEFVTQRNQVTILTTWYAGQPEFHSENNISIIRLKSKRKLSYQSNPYEMYDWLKMAKKYAKLHFNMHQFDVCFSNFTLPGGAVAYYLKKKYNLPFVILSHGHDIPWFSPKQMFFWHLLCYPLIKAVLKKSEYNILLTNQLKVNADIFLGKKYVSKNKVIPNGVLPFNFRKGFDAHEKAINAIFVGRLVEQKDPLTVIKCFQILRNKNIPIHLKIIGDGTLKNKVEEYITTNGINNIDLLGKISQSSVFEEYSKAHIFIAPSREEAMSLATLEALSCGLYVFVTKVSGNKDVIFEEINGNFVEYGNAEDIAEKIEQFYLNKFLKNYQYPNLMTEFMQQKYSWAATAQKYIDLFNEIISKKHFV
jgi:glycosyltransferase involved in cell wall biosynthesis